MTIDFTKPVQTRDGQPVTILTTERANVTYPVVGLINDDIVCTFTSEGKFCTYEGDHETDLVNVPVKHEVWINIYRNEHGCHWSCSYQTKEEADYRASPDRISCVRIEFEIADGL